MTKSHFLYFYLTFQILEHKIFLKGCVKMAIQDIKSKINDNKQEKERKLLNTALHLFTEKGIKKTSIQDIVHEAGIAKGTFYLYFKDKYELQDVLLAKTSHEFFANACKKANQHHFDRLDDKIVFIIDSIINELINRPNILKFIQKNLSLGLYSEKLTDLLDSEELGIKELFVREVKEKDIPLEYPEMTLFMIIELVSSTVFTSIVEKQPLPIDEFKPHLYKTIRLLINEKEL